MVWAERPTAAPGERIAAAARALVGTRYRPQGCAAAGVDCAGLVILALAEAGCPLRVEPRSEQIYALRLPAREEVEARLGALGLEAIAAGAARPGDIVLTEPAPGRLHFGIVTAVGVVEAHAGLRRVVERPWHANERILSFWRVA